MLDSVANSFVDVSYGFGGQTSGNIAAVKRITMYGNIEAQSKILLLYLYYDLKKKPRQISIMIAG
jgi:hypothetical protein